MARHGADGQADAVAAAVDELYGLPLSQFTAARGDKAKQARTDGDRDAAAVISTLRKPNVVAWLANQLARRHPDDLRPLLELGDSLRQATADLDAARLGGLFREQRQIVSALIGRARELAAEAGQAVSDSTLRGLEDTLHAALADDEAAQELIRGHLTAGLSRTGFPGLDAAAGVGDLTPAPAAEAPRTRKAASERRAEATQAAAEARQQQLKHARRAEAAARADAGEADRAQHRAMTKLSDAESAAQQAEEAIGRLQDELDAALDARNNAGRAQRQARKDAERADRAARQAARRLSEITSRREQLEREA